ncbi:MAG: hypothetical protein COZ31_02755 [Nitrospirae bacterium CG_4_10_14_3_um_filter_44_29]|nr:hypothetical protein [Nitrospirota bacterium]OIO29694.1 MAG: hypothetical protein AUJ60_04480 [Nitrospirae bacterium CG1_02_44_142]PIP71261.1 MAG: hypothetical protein COW90_00970 [Nitrospirae bacterium CG22_combo_CG10-13_8_21_14_all_44_11]PIV40211.1 MAG: hypothetical protein COS28_09980 [Nitrospirae bacterium CG02_land_8_20_14_3_00_44_33]PIV66401.1 MAG: hypothetical protein COS10_06400 [Nitrospirae bacterium CG01_land_8_20_14_3_00_44_22]PIW88838.1 MAG: hypothetical protein COZ93_08265 [Nit
MSSTDASNRRLIKEIPKAREQKVRWAMSVMPGEHAKDSLENIIGIAKSGIKNSSAKHNRYLYGSRSPVKIKGKAVSEIVLEDRR